MYLSYSGYQVADECLYRYWHTYLGKTATQPEDRLGSIYGSAVGLLFEEFYGQCLWRSPNVRAHMEGQVERVIDHCLEEATKPQPKKGRPGGIIKWKGDGEGQNPQGLYANRGELVNDVRASVSRGLSTIRVHRLLGRGAKAELKLDALVNGHILAGRADFVLRRVPPFDDLIIIDGKGSRKRDRYVSPTQLIWYSMLYAEHHGRVPDKAAFVYWHFDPPSNIDWCRVTTEETNTLKVKALRAASTLTRLEATVGSTNDLAKVKAAFLPKASTWNCRFCPYATEATCPQGFGVVTELERKKMEGQNGVFRPNSSQSRRSHAPSPECGLEEVQAPRDLGREETRAATAQD